MMKDGHIVTDRKEISDSINEYFCNIGQHLQQQLSNAGNSSDNFKRYLPPPNLYSFYLQPIDKIVLS